MFFIPPEVRENTLRKFIFEMIEKKVGFNLNQIIHIHKVLEKHDKNIVVAFFSMLNFAFLLFILIWKSAFSFLIITFQPRKHSYFLCLIFFFSLWLIFFLFWWRVDKKYICSMVNHGVISVTHYIYLSLFVYELDTQVCLSMSRFGNIWKAL